MACAVTAAIVALVLVFLGGSDTSRTREGPAVGAERARPTAPPRTHRGARTDCSTRSEANFPGAFTDPANLVVGPLVLVGGAQAARDPVSVIRRFKGQKLQVLVKAGHRVTVRIARRARAFAGLGYAPGTSREEQTGPRDSHRSVTFVACRPGEASGSYADGEAVTFWSGGVTVTRVPACVPLEVYVDDEPSSRRLVLSLAAGRCQE